MSSVPPEVVLAAFRADISRVRTRRGGCSRRRASLRGSHARRDRRSRNRATRNRRTGFAPRPGSRQGSGLESSIRVGFFRSLWQARVPSAGRLAGGNDAAHTMMRNGVSGKTAGDEDNGPGPCCTSGSSGARGHESRRRNGRGRKGGLGRTADSRRRGDADRGYGGSRRGCGIRSSWRSRSASRCSTRSANGARHGR